ncbi:MAG: RHS repeat-associated core domain-containing protein [Anaerolineaceae bacterium]|nr:RHS repeat-associated core domain-containing protein [Anaerolineaceae bacterium]
MADGEQTYLYGNTVVAQISETQTGYYLPDVLGSVRQMVDDEANLQLAQSFTPFGEELEKYGEAEANFGYAGQKYDTQTGLLYLRARYYAPGSGRFINRDTWAGNPNNPMSYNRWNYTDANPINRCDASGNCWYPNFQTGGPSFDFTNSNPGPCPDFVDAMSLLGYEIPENATMYNWVDYIPDNALIKENYLHLMSKWQIVYYGKAPESVLYAITSPIIPWHVDVDIHAIYFGIPLPIAVSAGHSIAWRSDDCGPLYMVENTDLRVSINIKAAEIGIDLGDNKGLYAEIEELEMPFGVKVGYPEIGFYTAAGETGIANTVYLSHWVMVKERDIYLNGGYVKFGEFFLKETGYNLTYLWAESMNEDYLWRRWNNEMRGWNLEKFE